MGYPFAKASRMPRNSMVSNLLALFLRGACKFRASNKPFLTRNFSHEPLRGLMSASVPFSPLRVLVKAPTSYYVCLVSPNPPTFVLKHLFCSRRDVWQVGYPPFFPTDKATLFEVIKKVCSKGYAPCRLVRSRFIPPECNLVPPNGSLGVR